MTEPRIGVVGATGAVGRVTLELLAARGYGDVRAFASSRSAGSAVPYDGRELVVEEATAGGLAGAGIDLCFFSVGTSASAELVPPTAESGVICIDKSDAFRLTAGVPLVVAGVNDDALDGSRVVANPNCSAMQLACVLKPLQEAAGLARVRLATYQSMSGAGDAAIRRLQESEPAAADLAMDWDFDGEEFSEEWKLRAETRKILDLPELPLSATCVRVPVLVGHAQAVWLVTEEPLAPEDARKVLERQPNVVLAEFPTPGGIAGTDRVHVGRIRRDPTEDNALALWIVNDNLRKGAALNAVQIARLLLARERAAA